MCLPSVTSQPRDKMSYPDWFTASDDCCLVHRSLTGFIAVIEMCSSVDQRD